ncbi:membrane protein insertase YidC [Oceanicoccus sp. KOV_DT_Chl]|uniref:membrane protein insertase YidC n=1 Tax=Oceanicoccus sp. KOV_DT_Chl TaxID=1904639 RepID=UPI000C7AFE2C|nr:membrane protein insertase YidC [Oceanicoccus sp. KOV_DT_Chl]
MDFQRYLLIGSIAALSFMLLTEWVQFKEDRSGQDVVAAYQQQTNQSANNSSAQIADSNAMMVNNQVDSIPSTADIPTIESVTSSNEEKPQININSVRIHTDALEVEINTLGGDIVFAALKKYYAKIDNPDVPFTMLEQSNLRTYVAQSGLIGTNGIDTSKGRAQYTTNAKEYNLKDGDDELFVDLIFQQQDVTITKRFIFKRGEYVIGVKYLIENNSSQPWTAGMFGQLKRDNTADPSADSSGMGMAPYLGAAIHLPEEPYKKISFDDIADKEFPKQNIEGGWVAIVQHYFTSAWIPDASQTHSYSMLKAKDEANIVRFTSPQLTVEPGGRGEITSQLYTGPKDQYRLETISAGLELTVDYGILWWIAQPLFWLLTKLNGYLGNWGFAIIAVTVLVKAAFFQLNAKAYTSMANMRKVQPKLVSIRERYADDKQKQSQEMMALYKKEKINPLGGCLPILVQMPVFISLYWVLMESVELRHAPFIGYIKDLSVMDPYFILPLIMGVSMFIQQKLNPPPPDPMQAKVMQWMPVMFTFFFLFFPAGLVLYWVVNNTLSIVQQYIITKRIEGTA